MFATKAAFMMMRRHPDMVFHHLTRGRFLEKKRQREHLEQSQANGQIQVEKEAYAVEESALSK